MLKKIFILFKIARKLALSDAIKVISKIHKPPVVVQILVNIFSISLTKKDYELKNLSDEEKLCKSIEGMGTTFIKLGQFLATRPDIIGEKLSKQLEKLQDRVPPFSNDEAKNILKDELGEEVYNSILNFSEPIAAASIAQVHKAQFNDNGTIKDIAIKILRPDIKKKFNEEIDALMLLAYLIENIATKTRRLKLMEVVFLLKEITNHEMDLRFEAAAANEFSENTTNDVGFFVPKIYWNFTSEKVLTLDWVEGQSIREKDILIEKGINVKNVATDIIQHFLRHAVRDGFFHADMHQGNLLIDNSGRIVTIDFGIMGRLDKLNRKFLAEILYGFILRDYKKVADVHIVAGLVPKNVNVDELAQALRRKLNPETNIWETSKPVLEKWLKETKDPISNLTETLKDSTEVLKRLPELPQIMDKANQALTFLASGQIPQNSNSYSALKDKEMEMKSFRNQSIIGLLLLVFFGYLVF